MVRYSIWRILIFFIVLLALYAATLRGWTLLVASAAVSLVVSFFALRGPRERFATQIEGKVAERQKRADAMRTAEDFDDED
ncbi:DUF4229 domain-containing protein [Rudaeicoccus suwonensis]|uniref:Uncharacterized protein DUF4229 n=1 Tax=Rudaeicoccus suwonensis TaxID=657409 RepID=A0A561DU61_9MICO|nr:DUF4229 domain-containing protein [Rudaeicoccus suwonensis]TWE06891.1 uncharacterized protein DUF4229 [Rudaeicoccus suwonensis]